RIGIARALSVNPEFLVCDEPVSALDVSIQSQILNLLADIREQMGLTMIFIAHSLNVVKHISNRIGVMYLGKLVEIADADSLFEHQYHPYTKALLSAIPEPRLHIAKNQIHLTGELPSPLNPPKGCRFCTRCPNASEKCMNNEPPMCKIVEGREVACFYPI
ncbi:MAG TPA: peptide ABC transporter substrate-binding protein, partial [Clostridiales bacterium]|nr:peptide ABC transporter substrate-binding protein [Clostridiales bacterium]